MSLLTRGADFLNRALGTGAGVTISYTRVAGGAAIEIDDAVVGRSSQTSQSGPGEPVSRFNFTERDYLIPADSLGYTPAAGDRIAETIDGTAYTFQVMPSNGLKEWDWCDSGKTRYRVRCKKA
jgi:hypothetical protein